MKSESRREENIHLSHAFWAPWIAIKSYCCTFLEKSEKNLLDLPKFIWVIYHSSDIYFSLVL